MMKAMLMMKWRLCYLLCSQLFHWFLKKVMLLRMLSQLSVWQHLYHWKFRLLRHKHFQKQEFPL